MDIPAGYEEVKAYGDFFSFDEVGKSIQGIFKGTEVINTQFGFQTYWKVVDQDGVLWLTPENKQLERYRTLLNEGDIIIVTFVEEKQSRAGNTFKNYSVYRKPYNQSGNSAPF